MKITYIFLTPSKERSIERVFIPIMLQMEKKGHETKSSFTWNMRFWPLTLLVNVIRYALKSHFEGIYHITGDVQYVACFMNPYNTILTIHDCVMLHNTAAPVWLKKMIHKYWYEKPLRKLKYIVCISETTRQDLIAFFPWIADKLIVVPNPVGEEFHYTPKILNEKCPQILHVGTRSNKNLERVIEALAGIKCQLNIIGKLSDVQQILLKKHAINYKNSFHVSDNEIVSAYQSADIISFPSLFEGFGMPIIEGQTIGRPVLTSDREPMKSVAGKNACIVNPESVESIRQGFLRLLYDAKYREKVTLDGQINAKMYNISNVLFGYESIYKQILK